MKLIWKQGLPKEVGWYWYRNLLFKGDEEPRIEHIRDYAGELAIGNSTLHNWTRMQEAEWAGPIPLPSSEKQLDKNSIT